MMEKIKGMNKWWKAYWVFILLLWIIPGFTDQLISWLIIGLSVWLGIKSITGSFYRNNKVIRVTLIVFSSVFWFALLSLTFDLLSDLI